MFRAAGLFALLAPLAACVSTLVPVDAGGGDGGAPDSGSSADGGGADGGGLCDAGPALQACAAVYAHCSTFTDLTGSAAFVDFGGTFGDTFSPTCVKVHAGQPVTFRGDFSAHQVLQACGPSDVIPSAPSGTSATFAFCVPGNYGYFCSNHGTASGNGMAGAILVVP